MEERDQSRMEGEEVKTSFKRFALLLFLLLTVETLLHNMHNTRD